MKKIITYCLFSLLSTLAFAQPAGWTFGTTSKIKEFRFIKNNLFLIDGQLQSPSIGDYVGIFTRINNTEKCVGYSIISDSSNFIVKAHGRVVPSDSLSLGYVNNSTFRIRWWRSTRNCQVVIDYSDSTYRLDTSASINISRMQTSLPNVTYSKSLYNIPSDINPSPIYPNTLQNLTFTDITKKLNLDTITGFINLTGSTAGDFTIKFSSLYCLQNDSFRITLTDTMAIILDTMKAPVLKGLTFDMLSPGCKTLGSIHFKERSIVGRRPFTFKLSTSYSQEVLVNSNGKFDELREGNYQLTVIDSSGKESRYDKLVSLAKQEDCSSAILAPNSKDGLQAIFIPEQGMASILNREGETVKRLAIPSEWDGRDTNGNFVPMGDYYLFVNEQQTKVITVIR